MMAASSPRQITGRHVLFGLLAFFGLVTVANAFMIYWAVGTFSGMETDNAYKIGVAYNERISAAAEQNALGWRESVSFDTQSENLVVTLTDKDGRGVDGLAVTAKIGRPATDVFDRSVDLAGEGGGKYTARLEGLGSGAWATQIAALEGADGSVIYRSRARLWKQP